MPDPPVCPLLARTTVPPRTACCLAGDWLSVILSPLPIVFRRSPARSGPPKLFPDNIGPFPITLLDSESPAKAGPPAWETPAVPSSAPTAAVHMTSSELSPSDPELAPANPAFSPKWLLTDHGCPRNPEVPSKQRELKILCLLQLFLF